MKVLPRPAVAFKTSRCLHIRFLLLLMAQLGMYSGCLAVEIGLPLDLLVALKLQHGM